MAGRTTPPSERPDASEMRVAVVGARFNADITEALMDGALRCLKECGAPDPDLVWVPGAFELPLACRELAVAPSPTDVLASALARAAGPSRRYDAIVALGCVIRGETAHFDLVAGEASRALMQVQLETGVPIGFGLVTTEDHEQAVARAGGQHGNKGYDAAMAALEMAATLRKIH